MGYYIDDDGKPYAEEPLSLPGGMVSSSIPDGSYIDIDTFGNANSEIAFSAAEDMVRGAEKYIPDIEGEPSELSGTQRKYITLLVQDVYNVAWALGKGEGIEDGMAAWNSLLNFPLDENPDSLVSNRDLDIMRDAAARFEKFATRPAIKGAYWVRKKEYFEAEDLKRFAGEHDFGWRETIEWCAEAASAAFAYWTTGDIKELFSHIIYMSDIFGITYKSGLQYFNDACAFYRDKGSKDLRYSRLNWDDAIGAITVSDIEAWKKGISEDDIFRGRSRKTIADELPPF